VIAGSDGKVARRKLAEWEEQQKLYENFDPDYTGIDWRQHYLLDDDEWRFDIIPEIVDGQNIADFYTEELERELAALLEEEAQRIAELEALDVNDEDVRVPSDAPCWRHLGDHFWSFGRSEVVSFFMFKADDNRVYVGRVLDDQMERHSCC
jgi:hypothetical protein